MDRPIIAAVAAVSRNGVVGRKGDLPWHIPEDLKFFREKTLGSPIIMGRKTFDSIKRPLPKRLNIVLTRQSGFAAEGVIVVQTIEQALEVARQAELPHGEIYIAGGGEIWNLAMPHMDRLYITQVDLEIPDGDAFFPGWPDALPSEFKETVRKEGAGVSPSYRFLTFDRQRP